VAERLGYIKPDQAIREHVDDADLISSQIGNKVGRPIIYINESGMNALILGSKKPEARDSQTSFQILSLPNPFFKKSLTIFRNPKFNEHFCFILKGVR
jgi:hypothetical protein